MNSLTLEQFIQAAQRYTTAKTEVLKDWQYPCQCASLGQSLECRDCLYYKKLGLKIQHELSEGKEKDFAVILPPELTHPYSDKVKQQAQEMFQAGYDFSEIKNLAGITDGRLLRKWLREVGLAGRSARYPSSVKEKAIAMYKDGYTPSQIQEAIGVLADTITDWIYTLNVARKPRHSPEKKQLCLDLYKEGKSASEIHQITKVPLATVKNWIFKAKIAREQKRYSEDEKRYCIALYESGKSSNEVAAITGIKGATIRSWLRQADLMRGFD